MDSGAVSDQSDESTEADRSSSERSNVDGAGSGSGSGPERYAGLGAVGVAVLLGATALSLFLWSGAQTVGTDPFWTLRKWSLVTGMLVVPALATGVVSLVPTGTRTLLGAVAGDALCVLAVGWFVLVYPFAWTAAGTDVPVTTLYLTGTVVLAVTTGSALVTRNSQHTPADSGGRPVETDGTAAGEDGSESDEESDEAGELVWVPIRRE
jgi:hypothetical protein